MTTNIFPELLSPAKNLEYGIAAINFGADAVYTGAPSFSARAAAPNSLADIEKLCTYAHTYHAKVFVALNTILYNNELEVAEKLIQQIYECGADALIIQDMGILEMKLPPLPIHASTQCHNDSLEKIQFMEKVGISRVVLARELSISQIHHIRKNTNIELEAFVHGAVCVSYSGQCYLSAYLGNRSGNRGECAQTCRLPFETFDQQNKKCNYPKHPISLKDMNRSEHILSMLDAGITTFKIEGRLKDLNYLKTTTALYRKKLDLIMQAKTHLRPSSFGMLHFPFEPDSERVFSRESSDYFLSGRKKNMRALSPKSVGKHIGKVTKTGTNSFELNTSEKITAGDGLCYVGKTGEMEGFQVQKVENKIIFTPQNIDITPGTQIYRNHDVVYLKKLDTLDTCRKIPTQLVFQEVKKGYLLKAICFGGLYEYQELLIQSKTPAHKKEKALEAIHSQLQKSGNTAFTIESIDIQIDTPPFIIAKELNQLRRNCLDGLYRLLGSKYQRNSFTLKPNNIPYPWHQANYKNNIANRLAKKFYQRHGVEVSEDAFEIQKENKNIDVMLMKYCPAFEMGACQKGSKTDNAPMTLKYKGNIFSLVYHCDICHITLKTINKDGVHFKNET